MEDKAIEREGNEKARESEKDAMEEERENGKARYCLDVVTALLTFHLPCVSFLLAVFFLVPSSAQLLSPPSPH